MIVNNILSRVLLGILTGCCLLACRGELPVLPSDEIDVGKDPLGGVDVYKRQVFNSVRCPYPNVSSLSSII